MSELNISELNERRDLAVAAVRATSPAVLRLQTSLAGRVRNADYTGRGIQSASGRGPSLRAAILEVFPDDVVLSKEDRPGDAELRRYLQRCWLIVPMDETQVDDDAFPICGPALAFVVNGQPVVAAVQLPQMGETLSAASGLGASLNGRVLKVAERRPLEQSIVLGTQHHAGALDITELIARLAGWRMPRTNSPLSALCYLATGRVDAFATLEGDPWDLAAGALLVREAGGSLSKDPARN